MKPISDKTLDTMEELALEGAKQIKAYFTYQGDNPAFLSKAKIGATTISTYGRLRASESNRMAVELAAKKASGRVR